MNLLSWNCQGVGNRDTVRVLGDLLKSINPAFVFLSETLVTSNCWVSGQQTQRIIDVK